MVRQRGLSVLRSSALGDGVQDRKQPPHPVRFAFIQMNRQAVYARHTSKAHAIAVAVQALLG